MLVGAQDEAIPPLERPLDFWPRGNGQNQAESVRLFPVKQLSLNIEKNV